MMTEQQEIDQRIFNDIVGWAKGIALSEGASRLELEHLFLGAMRSEDGVALLGRLLGREISAEAISKETARRMALVSAPETARTMPLTSELKQITDNAIRRHGKLTASAVMEDVARALERSGRMGSFWNAPDKATVDAAAVLAEVHRAVGDLGATLAARIVGQDLAIRQVCDAFFPVLLKKKKRTSLRGNGVAAVFTFLGPPGVGKTLTAQAIAAHFASADASPSLLRLDMSAYAAHQSHEQLVGFARAYSGASHGVLTGFVKANPAGIILVDEIEKAHRNAQHIFLQILDSGVVYDNHERAEVDFSKITVIFTTNLGQDLYDPPNRTGVLQEARHLQSVLLDGLKGSESGTREGQSSGLSPELLSRLAKGAVVLFQHLGGQAMEQIVDRTVKDVSRQLQQDAGVAVEVASEVVHTLFALRFGIGGDARRLAAAVEHFVYKLVSQTMAAHNGGATRGAEQVSQPLRAFRLAAPPIESLPETVAEILEGERNVLIVDDDHWDTQVLPNMHIATARNRDEADAALRGGTIDLALIDLHIGYGRNRPECDEGLGILRWLRARYPDIPVFLFSESPDRRGVSPELLERIRLEGGARGGLNKRFYGARGDCQADQDAFVQDFLALDMLLRRERLIEHYQRRATVLDFESVPSGEVPDADGCIEWVIGDVREVKTVSAIDFAGRGWCELPDTRLADVVGGSELKRRLQEVVGWLQDPGPLLDMGLDIPRGILLTGPPGTGKTTLARAVAGEAGVPFFAISGAEILSKWVGESEASIRQLFDMARRYAPSVVFVDEIDSIGRRRSGGDSGGRGLESLLNELLSQLDGFNRSDRPVFVLAATNRLDVLDEALVRPGRFDLRIEVPLPDLRARKALFMLHMRGLATDDTVDVVHLAARSAGMSGADIRQVCKEAGMLALREKRPQVGQAQFSEAVTIVRLGDARRELALDEESRHATAVHEAGHAIAQLKLFPEEPIAQVTILPRGDALGFMEREDVAGWRKQTAERVRKRIQVLLAGHVAEALILGDREAGAGCAEDLRQAAELAFNAVGNWGMDAEFGPVSMAGMRKATGMAEGALSLEAEVVSRARVWIAEEGQRARTLLEENRAALNSLASRLLERETLVGAELIDAGEAVRSDSAT